MDRCWNDENISDGDVNAEGLRDSLCAGARKEKTERAAMKGSQIVCSESGVPAGLEVQRRI